MTTPKKSLRIGRFLILKPLGRGLQGAVYLARDPDLDRLVAIKLVGATIAQPLDEGGGWSQARNLARLRHPNIVALHELGRFHNFTYLVFEYLEGVPLRKELNSAGALALPEAFSTISQVTDAMAYAHAKGILHLDLQRAILCGLIALKLLSGELRGKPVLVVLALHVLLERLGGVLLGNRHGVADHGVLRRAGRQ